VCCFSLAISTLEYIAKNTVFINKNPILLIFEWLIFIDASVYRRDRPLSGGLVERQPTRRATKPLPLAARLARLKFGRAP